MSTDKKWLIKNLCVFCGSSSPKDPALAAGAKGLTDAMLSRGIGLVYGGGTHGMMGLIGKAIHEGGGNVLGIIPAALQTRESEGTLHYGQQVIVESMHDRKFKMYQASDAFVALPGGFGTLDELLEILTWEQIGIHNRPVGLLNTAGFFDGLLTFVKHAVASGFISQQASDLLLVSDDPIELLNKLESHVPHDTPFVWTVKP